MTFKEDRPITFNGVLLPKEMRSVSIIEYYVELPEDVAEWLWRLPICYGVEKRSDSAIAFRAATVARDAILDHQEVILAGIRERAPQYEASEVFRLWMDGFTKIIESSQGVDFCTWSAIQPGDPPDTPERRAQFLEALDKFTQDLRKEAEPDGPANSRPGGDCG